MDTELISFLILVILVFIPALAFSARMALRPIVEALIRLRDGFVRSERMLSGSDLRSRPETIEAELNSIRDRMDRLEIDYELERELLADLRGQQLGAEGDPPKR